jgi:ribose transport system substrate-binding protein
VMENILQGNKQIDAVYTHDDDMAEGVIAAIENANREDEMFLTGAGGSKAIMDRIEKGGLVRATFLHNPTMAASAGMQDLTEPEVPSRIQVPATTVTKDNVADHKAIASRETLKQGSDPYLRVVARLTAFPPGGDRPSAFANRHPAM